MAQHNAALKRIRRDAKQTLLNHSRISRVRTFLKKVELALLSGDKLTAQNAFNLAQPEIMRGVSKGVIHRKTAARRISRLNARVMKLV